MVIFSSVYSGAKILSICNLLKSVLFKGFMLAEDLVPLLSKLFVLSWFGVFFHFI